MTDGRMVFLVGTGEYSDFHIIAAFDSEDEAKSFATRAPRERVTYGEAYIEGTSWPIYSTADDAIARLPKLPR